MKYLCFLSLILLVTSCKKPDCGPLSEPALAALAWMKPYEGKTFEVFEDQSGNVDTILIYHDLTEKSCFDGDCVFNCSSAKVNFQSVKNQDVNFMIENKGQIIEFNNPDTPNEKIQGKYDVIRMIPTMVNSLTGFYHPYSPQDDAPKIIQANSRLGGGQFRDVSLIQISLDSGLVRFETMDENVWLKKE